MKRSIGEKGIENLSDKNVFFTNRFQTILFEDYLSIEFAFQMKGFAPNGIELTDNQVQTSQFITMTTSDAKELAIVLVDLIQRVEKDRGVHFPMNEVIRTLWEKNIRNADESDA